MKTLKRILLVVAITFCAISANAKIVNFGIKAGLNVNKLSFNKEFIDKLTSPDNSAGWEAGVMAEINLPVVGLGFDASLMYARMNNSTQAYTDNFDGQREEYFNGKNAGKNFLMIPINVKYKFQIPAIKKFMAPYIFTGPDFAFKLDKNFGDALKTRTCQVAWNVGVGIQLIDHIQIGASYGFGINNIAEKTGYINSPEAVVKNNYWTVTAAWIF